MDNERNESFLEINGFLVHVGGTPETGYVSQLTIDASLIPDQRQVDKCYGPYSYKSPVPYYFLDSTGKVSPTLSGSIENLKKDVLNRIKRFEKHGDLRPSQVRKLELLKKFIG